LTTQSKIQTFSGLTTFGQDKKKNQLFDLYKNEKQPKNIDLQIEKQKIIR
jgi:hypothetical protein